jgi:two-component system NarL family sensor kinase
MNPAFFKRITIVILLLQLLVPSLSAQDDAIAKLKLSLKTATEDSSRMKILDALAIKSFRNDPEAAKNYARRSLSYAIQLKDYKLEAHGYNVLGVVLASQGRYDSAFLAYSQELAIAIEHKDETIRLKTLHNRGLAYAFKGDYTKSLQDQLEAQKGSEQAHDTMLVANCLTDIGNIYYRLESNTKALEFYQKALILLEKKNDKSGIANTLNSMGAVYSDMKQNQLAIQCYTRSLTLKKEINDRFGIAPTLINLGNLSDEEKEYVKAIQYFEQAYNLSSALSDKSIMITALHNISNTYRHQDDNVRSIMYGLRALNLADSTHTLYLQRESALGLALTYAKMKDFTNAYKYHRIYSTFNDSVVNESKNKELALMQTRFDTEKKEKENLLLSDLNQHKDLVISRQNTQRIILTSFIALLIVIGFLVYTRYRSRQRQLLDAEIIRHQQLRSKAIIESEEKERIRISRDLHDGIGQILSAAKLNVSALESSLSLSNPDQKILMKNALEMIDQSVTELRTVSHNLMPNALLKAGLGTAVREFLNRISDSDKLKVDLQVVGLQSRLEGTTETILFRVLQEVVNNVIKHAKTSYIGIQLIHHDDEMMMMIEDTGVGFDTSKINDFSGIGLKNIQSRIAYLNGTVDFDSHPGKGTTVTIQVPLSLMKNG